MQINVQQLGKKFKAEWILRHVDLTFKAGGRYAFIGSNGSGKSTLIQMLTGFMPITEGTVTYHVPEEVHIDDWYKYVILASPYMELIEEFTLLELVNFHHQFKPFKNGMTVEQFIAFTELSHAKDKALRYFSSGMKMRVRLALAFQTDVPIVFLDEPTSNLDKNGVDWYLRNVSALTDEQIVIIGSNQSYEYDFCDTIISMASYK